MKLQPLQGIESLRFGDPISKAELIFGEFRNKRLYPDGSCSITKESGRPGLVLGFDRDGQLDLIVVHESQPNAELWGGHPFEIARQASDVHAAVRLWIEGCGRHPIPHQTSFGGRYDVDDEGVSFVFSTTEPDRLEAIQLSVSESKTGAAQPDGPANGRQPARQVAMRTPPLAGFRR